MSDDDNWTSTIMGDLRRNVADVAGSGMPLESRDYMTGTVWPFLEAFVEAIDGQMQLQAAAIDEIARHESELLHPETAELLASAIAGGMKFAVELGKRLGNATDAESAKLRGQIANYAKLAQSALDEIEVLTLDDDDDEEDGEDGDSEEEDDDEGEDGDDDDDDEEDAS